MAVKLHECHRRVDAKVKHSIILAFADPCEICLIKMMPKSCQAMFKNSLWVVIIESDEKFD